MSEAQAGNESASQTAAAGWYPAKDSTGADVVRYWDGRAWTSKVAYEKKQSWQPPWWLVIVGFFLCLAPGLILLWLRRSTPVGVKLGVSAIAVLVWLLPSIASAFTSGDPDGSASSVRPARATPTPEASATHSGPPAVATPVAQGEALTALSVLEVKGRAPKTGYDRDLFGVGWLDVDANGCVTRDDILREQLASPQGEGCEVRSGVLDDPYSGSSISYVQGGDLVDIDHVVSLSDAWQKGAADWPVERRIAFANDPLNLLAVDSALNRQKGDGDAATWLPPNKDFRCEYVAAQVAVKSKYDLWVAPAEADAIERVLSKCPEQALPVDIWGLPTEVQGVATPTPPAPAQAPQPSPTPVAPAPLVPQAPAPPAPEANDPSFGTCKDAKANGYGPYVRGEDPEYDWYRDGDGDGIVCE